jgi:asparagine synthase (glutamine-hydrolysing)
VALDPSARPDADRVRRMSLGLCHRGPDGEGIWVSPSGRACFAHRRLAVIDLATGQQPMLDESGSVGLVFNGEVYNYRELREPLERGGVAFRTTSDTEVLLKLYAQDGDRCVDALRGMFAFAIWDDRRGRLTLARDRVGKKPFYYQITGGCLYFASTLASLLAGETEPPISLAAVDAFLDLGYVPAPGTIFDGISKLEMGTVTVYDGPVATSSRRFWDLAPLDPFEGSHDDALEQLDALLHQAVEIRLRSDVPLGVFLSGGIDSSLVTAIAARQAPGIRTFSIGFDVAAFDESAHAALVAEALGTEHRQFHVAPDLLGLLPSMVRHFGEPFGDSSALPVWLLAQETRKHVTVALGGDGGDEGFGGYDWYLGAARLERFTRMVPRAAAMAGGSALGWAGGAERAPAVLRKAQRGFELAAARDAASRFADLRALVGRHEAGFLYGGALGEHRRLHGAEARARIAEFYRQAEGGPLRRMRYADMRTYLAECLMPKVDVATMAHGLEARAPLLDQDVLRFAMSLPEQWLVDRSAGKKILRTLLGRYVPPALFERPKQGFSVPLATWFAGGARDRVDALGSRSRLLESGWFRPDGIRRLVREHLAGTRDNSERLFNLLALDEWLAQR